MDVSRWLGVVWDLDGSMRDGRKAQFKVTLVKVSCGLD